MRDEVIKLSGSILFNPRQIGVDLIFTIWSFVIVSVFNLHDPAKYIILYNDDSIDND